MIEIGLTGGIGSGKTTVSKIFADKGIPVFNSDLAAREAEKDPEIRRKFIDILGEEIVVDGELDRTKMRNIIFNNQEILNKVNALITPEVMKAFQKFKEGHTDKKMVVLESAIIFENKAANAFDYIVSVVADKRTRINRVMARDGLTVEMVEAKMSKQVDEVHRITNADFIIINDDGNNSGELLNKQVDRILDYINLVNA